MPQKNKVSAVNSKKKAVKSKISIIKPKTKLVISKKKKIIKVKPKIKKRVKVKKSAVKPIVKKKIIAKLAKSSKKSVIKHKRVPINKVKIVDEIPIELLIIPDHIDPDIEAFASVEQDIPPFIVIGPVKKKNYLNNKDLMMQVMMSKEQKQMNNILAHMLQTLCKRYAKKGNFANYCVDDTTTTLTKRGWTSYNNITTNDEILSYDIHTGQLKWSKVLDLYINKYQGQMHHLTTEGLDALVTPNHKFVSAEYGIKPVEDIICNEHIVLMGDPVPDEYGHFLDMKNIEPYSDFAVEVVGWAITEGHYIKNSVKKRCINISQKRGPKADKLRNSLQFANVPFKEYCHSKKDILTFYCTGPLICDIYDNIAPNRVLSVEFILSLSHHQRMLLINTMVLGDGWIRPSGGMSYLQKDKNHIDAFLMLCTLSGLTTYTVLGKNKTPPSEKYPNGSMGTCYTVNVYTTPKKQCKAERIDFHGGKQSAGGIREQKPNIPTREYDGIIWCPTTEYGTFICRRNGYIYVAGNSYNEDMQGYAMLMLVKTWNSFDPKKSNNPFAFFTQCIKNSFIQYLNQERRQRDIKNEMLIDSGLNPSHSYILDHESKNRIRSSDEVVDPVLLPSFVSDMNVDKVLEPNETV